MGWGTKKAATPQPVLPRNFFQSPAPLLPKLKGDDEAERELRITEPVETPSQAHKDRMANGALMARWAPETATRFVMEFLAEKQLFGELNAYLKRKIR